MKALKKSYFLMSCCYVLLVLYSNIIWAENCDITDTFFFNDLYPASIPIDESATSWVIDQNFISQSIVSGTVTIDPEMRYDDKPALFLHPTEKTTQVSISHTVVVEQGQFYSFTCVARGSNRNSDDAPTYLPCYGFISIAWLDANGSKIPIRDKLMSRSSGEQDWHVKQVSALAPHGAVKAVLTIKAGANAPREDSGMWFAEIKWSKAIPVPVKLDLIPRVLRSTDEQFTVRIERRAQYSLGADSKMRIEMVDKTGNVLRQWMSPFMITLPWSIKTKLPPGQNDCRIRVKGEPFKTYPGASGWELSEPVLVANSDIDAKFRDGSFILNGQKRVVLGCYHAQPQDYAILKDAGINAVIFKCYDANESLEICDKLSSMGMYAIAHVGGASQTVANKPRVKAAIEAIRGHNALTAFSLMDEPTRKGIGPREIAWFGCWVQSLAPNIPTTANFAGPYTFDRFATTTDIFSSDPYPIYFAHDYGCEQADLRVVSQWNDLAQNVIDSSRGCIAVIETFSFDKENKPPATALELRNMVFQTFCSGITSVIYYSVRDAGWYLPDEPIFTAVKDINGEILTIERWLVEGPVKMLDRPIEFITEKPDELITNTWKNESDWLTIVINLSREDLTVQALSKKIIVPAEGENLSRKIILNPLEVKVFKYKIE